MSKKWKCCGWMNVLVGMDCSWGARAKRRKIWSCWETDRVTCCFDWTTTHRVLIISSVPSVQCLFLDYQQSAIGRFSVKIIMWWCGCECVKVMSLHARTMDLLRITCVFILFISIVDAVIEERGSYHTQRNTPFTQLYRSPFI